MKNLSIPYSILKAVEYEFEKIYNVEVFTNIGAISGGGPIESFAEVLLIDGRFRENHLSIGVVSSHRGFQPSVSIYSSPLGERDNVGLFDTGIDMETYVTPGEALLAALDIAKTEPLPVPPKRRRVTKKKTAKKKAVKKKPS